MEFNAMQNLSDFEVNDKITEEAKENFLKFLEEVKDEAVNCSIVNHTNHSNFSMW